MLFWSTYGTVDMHALRLRQQSYALRQSAQQGLAGGEPRKSAQPDQNRRRRRTCHAQRLAVAAAQLVRRRKLMLCEKALHAGGFVSDSSPCASYQCTASKLVLLARGGRLGAASVVSEQPRQLSIGGDSLTSSLNGSSLKPRLICWSS